MVKEETIHIAENSKVDRNPKLSFFTVCASGKHYLASA